MNTRSAALDRHHTADDEPPPVTGLPVYCYTVLAVCQSCSRLHSGPGALEIKPDNGRDRTSNDPHGNTRGGVLAGSERVEYYGPRRGGGRQPRRPCTCTGMLVVTEGGAGRAVVASSRGGTRAVLS